MMRFTHSTCVSNLPQKHERCFSVPDHDLVARASFNLAVCPSAACSSPYGAKVPFVIALWLSVLRLSAHQHMVPESICIRQNRSKSIKGSVVLHRPNIKA